MLPAADGPLAARRAARYQREPAQFEWFFGHTALRRILRAHVSKKKPVLHVGCGTSNLQEGMAKSGYTVVNVRRLAAAASTAKPAAAADAAVQMQQQPAPAPTAAAAAQHA